MSDIFFNNGKNLDLSRIRTGMSVGSDNDFLKKYDKNNNSIFEVSELDALKKDIEASCGDDNVLNETESLSLFAKVMNLSLSKAKEIFGKKSGNMVYSGLETIQKDTAQQNSINQIRGNAQMGMQILNRAQGGVVSQAWNSVKEFWDADLAQDKVYRQLAGQTITGILLEKAQSEGGISQKEYLETKIEFFKMLVGADKMTEMEQKHIEKAVSRMTPKELDKMITTLKNAESADYEKTIKQTMQELAQKTFTMGDSANAQLPPMPNSIGGIMQSHSAESILSFEDTFWLEQGTPFNQEAINDYAKLEQDLKIAVTRNNRIATLSSKLDEPLKNLDNFNRHGATPEQIEQQYKYLSASVLNVLNDLYGTGAEEMLKTLSGDTATIKDGVIDFGLPALNNQSLVNLARKLQEGLNSKIQTEVNGKPLEECEVELKSLYDKAYGTKNAVDLAEKFEQNQQEGVGYAKMLSAGVGGVVCAVSGGALIPLTMGVATSAFGPVMTSYIEAASKSEGITPQDKEAIKQELMMGLALGGIGAGIGKLSTTACQQLLLRNCPTLLAKASVVGSDVMLGLLTDYTITGEIDLKAEGIAQIINIATGLLAHYKYRNRPVNITDAPKTPDVEMKNYIKNIAAKNGADIPQDRLNKVAENLANLKKENSPLYSDIENSGILKLYEQGKIDFKDLEDICSYKSKDVRISSELMDDYKKMANNEPFVKEYSSSADMKKVMNETPLGEVAQVGSDLYINDGKKMTKLDISKEKYEELFPPGKRFNVNQNENKNAGNCWFLETSHNLYQNPSTRINILKLFRQEGDDIYVKLPDSKYEYKFPNGGVPKNKHSSKNFLSDSPKWMNMLEYVGAITRKNDGKSLESTLDKNYLKNMGILSKNANGDDVFDVASYVYSSELNGSRNASLSRLYAGTPDEAVEMLTGKNAKTKKYYINQDDAYLGTKLSKDEEKLRAKQRAEIRKHLEDMDGKKGFTANIAIGNHAYTISRVENGKVYVQDPYNTKVEQSFSMDEIIKLCRYMEISEFKQ